jgi:hypothetical protein
MKHGEENFRQKTLVSVLKMNPACEIHRRWKFFMPSEFRK